MREQQDLEKTILEAMWDVLEDPSLESDSNFFEAGGNSLLAAVLIERLEKQTGRNLRIRNVLQNPTARSLARMLLLTP